MKDSILHFKSITRYLLMAFIVFVFGQMSLPTEVCAQSVILQRPSGDANNPNGPFAEFRDGRRYHEGVDILTGTGHQITTSGRPVCEYYTGGGNVLISTHACCVEEKFMHLQSCDTGSGTYITNNTGSSTSGAHIHWEVRIKGVIVDPDFAVGKNLCDPAIQNAVIADGYSKIPPSHNTGGGASSGACSTPQPPDEPPTSSISVPTGSINPTTGVINTGPPIIITKTIDGRITTIIPPSIFSPPPPLNPSVTTGFTQSGSTSNPVTGCATDTWVAMTNQSVLQTRREMMMNQRYIAKPDSVLAYSCIGSAAAIAGENIGPLFSENTWWGNQQIDIKGGKAKTSVDLGQGSLDGAINSIALSLIDNYIISSFNHDYLGGIYGETALPQIAADGAGSDNITLPQSSLNCSTMANVWNLAKCGNFGGADLFPTFQDLVGNDLRTAPRIYQCQDSGITQGMIDTAKGQSVNSSPMVSHLDILAGKTVTNTPSGPQTTFGGGCAPPIPTGITVIRRKGASIISLAFDYTDAICPTPGCSYQNSATWGLGTCSK